MTDSGTLKPTKIRSNSRSKDFWLKSKMVYYTPYQLQHADAWHWLDLNMKDWVKWTKNEVSIISWKNHPLLGFKPKTSHSTVYCFTICAILPFRGFIYFDRVLHTWLANLSTLSAIVSADAWTWAKLSCTLPTSFFAPNKSCSSRCVITFNCDTSEVNLATLLSICDEPEISTEIPNWIQLNTSNDYIAGNGSFQWF